MAGTRAMNGDASRATTAIHPMAERQPGSARAARAPSTIRRTIGPMPVTGSGCGRWTSRSATTTAPNDRALMPKTNGVVAGQQDQAGEGRSDHPAEVVLRRRERHRAQQVLGGHEVGHHGLVGGKPDRPRTRHRGTTGPPAPRAGRGGGRPGRRGRAAKTVSARVVRISHCAGRGGRPARRRPGRAVRWARRPRGGTRPAQAGLVRCG